MVDATATTTATNTTTTTNTTNTTTNTQSLHSGQSTAMSNPSTSYNCTSCQVTFNDSQEQRKHMKEAWHVYNIKRRIASLPPLSQEVFEKQIQSAIEKDPSPSSSSDEESSAADERSLRVSPLQCLFCNCNFAPDDKSHDSEDDETTNEDANDEANDDATLTAFTTNLEHMRATHNLQIPNLSTLTDPHSFIEYLATEIRVWHECLYCGATKPSTAAIQAHMRDKAHCMLNFDREPELLEFWEEGVPKGKLPGEGGDAGSAGRRLEEGEMRTESGRILGSKQTLRAAKREAKKRTPAARLEAPDPSTDSASDAEAPSSSTANPQPQPQPDSTTTLTVREGRRSQDGEAPPPPSFSGASNRQLARRELMGITGLSEQQRHALVLAEKKAQRSEAVAQRARDWIRNRGGNKQQHDQILTSGFKGRQNHKLMPR